MVIPVDTVTVLPPFALFRENLRTQYVSTRLGLGTARPAAAQAARKFLRLARLRPFPRQDRARPREPLRSARRCRRNAGAWRRVTGAHALATALYIASHAYAIEGMELAAAQKLFADLIDAATAPELSYVHIWRNGTSSCGTTARPCIAVDHGPRTRRGLWCARRSPRPRGFAARGVCFSRSGCWPVVAPITVEHCTDAPERSLRCVVTTCQR